MLNALITTVMMLWHQSSECVNMYTKPNPNIKKNNEDRMKSIEGEERDEEKRSHSLIEGGITETPNHGII